MILLLSLSFKNTPQKVREYFAFGREDKERLLTLLCEEKEIDEALTISKNLNYVNGILNNKVSNDIQKESGSSLGYDWFNK